MLVVWNSLLVPEQQRQIWDLDPRASFWPRSWAHSVYYNSAVPLEWWISFSSGQLGLVWVLRYSEHSRIIYRS